MNQLQFDNEAILQGYVQEWRQFKIAAKELHGSCDFLYNALKNYQDYNKEGIYNLAVKTWHENIFKRLNKLMTNVMLDLINQDRNGNFIDQGRLVKEVIECFKEFFNINKNPKSIVTKCFR